MWVLWYTTEKNPPSKIHLPGAVNQVGVAHLHLISLPDTFIQSDIYLLEEEGQTMPRAIGV